MPDLDFQNMTELQRESRRTELYSLLGDLPPRNRPITVRFQSLSPSPGTPGEGGGEGQSKIQNPKSKIQESPHPNPLPEYRERGQNRPYEIECLVLDLNGLEDVPAYFIKPLGTTGRLPVVLYNHWHGGQYELGKEGLLLGHGKSALTPYADELTKLGYAVLAIDHWAFGQRSTRSESDLFKDMLWHGRVLWGMMVYDSLRAVDYLISRDDIDANRIATLGMSMGSTMAWWLAALDTRIRVCVDICCLTDFQALMEADNLKGHGLYYYVPGLLQHFTVAQINELIVPRAHLGLAGNLDSLTPPSGLDRIDAALRKAYADAGVPDRWQMWREDVAHIETEAMREQILKFLQKWL